MNVRLGNRPESTELFGELNSHSACHRGNQLDKLERSPGLLTHYAYAYHIANGKFHLPINEILRFQVSGVFAIVGESARHSAQP
jgi:hypothetical protein